MLNHIDYIYEIYKEGAFTKAAEKLFVSQPALSLAIKKLEDEIDEAEEQASSYYTEEKSLREKLTEKENALLKLKAEAEMNENLLRMAKERFSKLETEKANISTQQSDTDKSKKQLLEVISGSDALIEKADAYVALKQEEVRKKRREKRKNQTP